MINHVWRLQQKHRSLSGRQLRLHAGDDWTITRYADKPRRDTQRKRVSSWNKVRLHRKMFLPNLLLSLPSLHRENGEFCALQVFLKRNSSDFIHPRLCVALEENDCVWKIKKNSCEPFCSVRRSWRRILSSDFTWVCICWGLSTRGRSSFLLEAKTSRQH